MMLGTRAKVLLEKAFKISGDMQKNITFRFVDSVAYDPSTGLSTVVEVSQNVLVHLGRFSDEERRSGMYSTNDYKISVPLQRLNRLPETQDRAVINGVEYQVDKIAEDVAQALVIFCAKAV